MTTYDLYLESGPRHRKTMVHALDLLGCVAVGPTTEAAIDAASGAIRAYRRFLHRHGEPVDPETPFDTRIAEHITTGAWLGNGSPYLAFGPDFDALTAEEVETLTRRFQWMREELASWTEAQSDGYLDTRPATGGRAPRAILLHVLGPTGAYLSSALGSAPGFSRIHGAAERGEMPLPEALRRSATMAAERLHATTPAEWSSVRELASGPRTLRKALRRMLEHDWEHLAELSRRPDGPSL